MRVFDILCSGMENANGSHVGAAPARCHFTFETPDTNNNLTFSKLDRMFYEPKHEGVNVFYGRALQAVSRKIYPQLEDRTANKIGDPHTDGELTCLNEELPQWYVSADSNSQSGSGAKDDSKPNLRAAYAVSGISRHASSCYEKWLNQLKDGKNTGLIKESDSGDSEGFEHHLLRQNEKLLFEGSETDYKIPPLWKHFVLKSLIENASTAMQQVYSEILREEFAEQGE